MRRVVALLVLPVVVVAVGCGGSTPQGAAAPDVCGEPHLTRGYGAAPSGGVWYDSGDVWPLPEPSGGSGAVDDGSGDTWIYDDGSDPGSGDDGSQSSGDDGSGDDSSSAGDDSSGDDSSGDDSSGDDSTESHRIRLKNVAARDAPVCVGCAVTCVIDAPPDGAPTALAARAASDTRSVACLHAQAKVAAFVHAAWGRRITTCTQLPPTRPAIARAAASPSIGPTK